MRVKAAVLRRMGVSVPYASSQPLQVIEVELDPPAVTAGLPPPDAALAVSVVNLVAEERTLKGSYIGTSVPARDIPQFISLYRAGRLPVDRLMSGNIGLSEINEGFDRLHRGAVVRLAVVFE
jgi:alcohol dehydrogenase